MSLPAGATYLIESPSMTHRRYVLIVNPRGGTRRGLALLEAVKPVFAAAGAEFEIHITTHSGHARELARALPLDGASGLCILGGDGTLHETVNGLMLRDHPDAVPLGLIPGGTGNAVAEHLGCADPREAARRILAGASQPLDVARVSLGNAVSYSINIVGWGFVVDISRTAERLRGLGRPRYTLAALWEILRARQRHARITLDGQVHEGEFLFATCCNTKFTGRGMKLAPRAELGDGELDVVLVRHASRTQIFKMLTHVYDGTHIGQPGVEYHRVRSFAIESDTADRLNIDGEITGATPVALEIQPAALRVFA